MWSTSLWFSLWGQDVSLATCLREIAVLHLVFCDHCHQNIQMWNVRWITKSANPSIPPAALWFLWDSKLAASQWLRLTQQSTAMGQEGLPPCVIHGLALLWRIAWLLGGRTAWLSFSPLWLFVLDVTSWGVSSQLPLSRGIMGQKRSTWCHPTTAREIYLEWWKSGLTEKASSCLCAT